MSVASSGNLMAPAPVGHVGILDYDGSWINAGALDINKFIHLTDPADSYKPAHFRRR
jgi:hypothetical protein